MDKISDNKFEILLFLEKKSSYVREFEAKIKIPKSTISDKLNELYKQNIVDFKIIGRNKVFYIKDSIEAKIYLRMLEEYKLIKLLRSYPKLKPVINEIINNISNEIVLIFGSYVKGTSTEKSDIDIFINTNSRKIKDEIEMINSKISVKIGDLTKDSFLKNEIIKSCIILNGYNQFQRIKNGKY